MWQGKQIVWIRKHHLKFLIVLFSPMLNCNWRCAALIRLIHWGDPVNHGRLARWIKWRVCDVGEAKEGLENELWRRWSNGRVGERAVTRPVFNYRRGSGILICLDFGCVSFVFYPVLSPAEVLILCWPHIQGGPPFCICLVFWSIDNCSPYRHLIHGHLVCKALGM